MTLRDELWQVALDRYGFVTAQDAYDLGVDVEELSRLARRGKLTRAAHGVYRFAEFPTTARDEYMLAVLWAGPHGAVLGHDTALRVYDLCAINPDRIHLTVPRSARIQRSGGNLYVLHHQDLRPDQVGWWEGIPTVTEYTAIDQGIASNVPIHLIEQAIATARRTGRITATQEADLSVRIGTVA